MAQASDDAMLSHTQLISRFDRNGPRLIGLELLRQVRRSIRRRMRAAGARGAMIWRLARTPAGITVTAYWHPNHDVMIRLARPTRRQHLGRHRQSGRNGIPNRRWLGSRPWSQWGSRVPGS